MAVSVDICNDALNHLGAEYITSLAEESKTARVCSHQYPLARDFMLRTYVWNFALTRQLLTYSQLVGDVYMYNLPADCIRINKLLSGGAFASPRYKVEGRQLFTNAETVTLSYISKSVSEGLYDVAFNKAVAARLAADMCFNITQSNSLQGSLYALADNIAKDARSTDSMESTPDDFTFAYFDDSRRLGHEIYSDAYEL